MLGEKKEAKVPSSSSDEESAASIVERLLTPMNGGSSDEALLNTSFPQALFGFSSAGCLLERGCFGGSMYYMRHRC